MNYEHNVVRHAREFVSGKDIHVNTAESFFALLKWGIHGTFHHIDKKTVDMYCGEFGFRFNTRALTDLERFIQAVTHCDGRLRWYFNAAKA
ncbi:MAG: transposase [bacterium]